MQITRKSMISGIKHTMEIDVIDYMGSDLSVVNAARVSFAKKSDWRLVTSKGIDVTDYEDAHLYQTEKRLSAGDQGLIRFLARGCTTGDWEGLLDKLAWAEDSAEQEAVLNYVKRMPDHWTPFGHTAITLHIKAPIFVARQLGKHQVGLVWNEVSRRYVDDTPEFYIPDAWRKRAENVKQGSSDEEVMMLRQPLPNLSHSCGRIRQSVGVAYAQVLELYEEMLASGVCPEQARMVLPQSMYTEWYWTGSIAAFSRVYNLRIDPHTQKETQEVARQIGDLIKPLFPVSWEALTA